jgi:hypothetical protein
MGAEYWVQGDFLWIIILIFSMILFSITEAVNSLKGSVNKEFINLLTHGLIRYTILTSYWYEDGRIILK